jgi:hypothetical protein
MRVLITGGTGLIGKATTERLLERGWDVRVLGLEPEFEFAGAEYAQCNVLDYDDLLRHMRGCDSVIHLAAVRSPNLAPGHEVYRVNVMGTFNVFEAAAAAGIGRVVQASSINALGCFYGTGDLDLDYLPVDEEHPTNTTDPYSYSKQTIEEMGDYFWRRDGISGTALRFPGVYLRGYPLTDNFHHRQEVGRALLAELLSLPEAERQARLDDAKAVTLDYRRQRPLEYHPDAPPALKNPMFENPLYRAFAFDRYNLWAFIDERDTAQSLEKSVTADYEGAHALFINDSVNYLGYDSRTLARLFFPNVTEFKTDLSGASALVSIDKARRLIGYEPEHSIAALGLAEPSHGEHHD